ncbi:MAG: hypothetical protein Q4G68_04895 [Planctomycetia bacterium]|nr:hypothetical protein [Planctomycetia bacterium]
MYRITGIILLSCLLLAGCSGKQKVTGHVTFDDGSPVPRGTLYFTSDSYAGRANLNPDGTYDVSSISEKDGLPHGTYKVYIVGAFESDQREVSSAEKLSPEDIKSGNYKESSAMSKARRDSLMGGSAKPLVHPKYCTVETTPLSFTVPGDNNFDFSMERFIKKEK